MMILKLQLLDLQATFGVTNSTKLFLLGVLVCLGNCLGKSVPDVCQDLVLLVFCAEKLWVVIILSEVQPDLDFEVDFLVLDLIEKSDSTNLT